jgi:hypothetical protein
LLGKSYSYDGIVETGEIWDRYRTLVKPQLTKKLKLSTGTGLHYCMLNLRGLVYTGKEQSDYHIERINPLWRRVAHVARMMKRGPHEEFLHHNNHAILSALKFYAQYYIQYPIGTEARIEYEPYYRQQLGCESMIEFLIGSYHYHDEPLLHQVINENITHHHMYIADPSHHPILQYYHPINIPMSYMILIYA